MADRSEGASNPAPTIVAVGASAGGLDAMNEFFKAAQPDPRLCFVVVTHLPPHHVSYLAEILTRAGTIGASQAIEGQPLEGGHVYVMPPGKWMGVRNGSVFFEENPAQSFARKPIDFFMVSLAEDAPDRSIGVVLSGTDHDGTVGLKAIRAAGGLTLVQSPSTADFSDMPNSAIEAGVVDLVLPPAAMYAALLEMRDRNPADADSRFMLDEDAPDEPDAAATDPLSEVLAIVLARTGNDFRWYRQGMLRRRLRRRMVLLHRKQVADYLELLTRSPDEATALGREFLIGVTDFFRDPEAWDELADNVLPVLLAERTADEPVFRAWTPGCSSGEESYSLAMLLLEQLEARDADRSVQIFGTDIDQAALAVARRGVYPKALVATVSPARLQRFFEPLGEQYNVRKQLRDAVMFAPQNLVRDTPFSRLDLICCRNLLMYFDPALQEQVFGLFHFALKPGGLLWLGKAESLGARSALFEPVSRTHRLFRRIGDRSHLPPGFANRRSGSEAAPDARQGASPPQRRAAEVMRQHLAARRVSAAVLIDGQGRVLYFHGDTGRFFAPHGDATLELLHLVRPELRPSTRSVVRQSLDDAKPASLRTTLSTSTGTTAVVIEAEPITTPDSRSSVLVLFTEQSNRVPADGPTGASTVADGHLHTPDFEHHQHDLAVALAHAERSYDELRLSNEESSALNEELQSSNEELESSREELQSLNEELATVNTQLEDKIGEIARNADDLTNLLDSTHIATLLLDRELRLRRFTPSAAGLFSLQAGDQGRLLSDFSSRVDDPAFASDAIAVLASQPNAEAEVLGGDGQWFLRRLQPYVSTQGQVEGVVATFVDITPVRSAARQLRQLTAVLEDSNDAVFSYDLTGRILTWNRGAETTYGHRREEALSKDVFSLVPDAGRDAARDLIEAVRQTGAAGPVDVERRTSEGRLVKTSMSVTALRDDRGEVCALLSTERDITERLRAESEIRFRRLADDIPALLRVEDRLGHAEFVNQACIDYTGRPREELLHRGWLEFVHPQDRERYLSEHAAAETATARIEVDLRLKRSDGSYRWMRSISVPQVDASGEFAGYVALMLDVEDRKRAESELLGAISRKDQFLAMLAHELRNPLAPIRSAVSILSRSAFEDHRAEWSVGVIGRQVEILAKLLDGLLDVARISSGKEVLDPVPLELQVIADRAVELSQPLFDARRQHFTAEVHGDLLVEGDLLRLTQVVANLLNNASKYSDQGAQVKLTIGAEAGEAVIRVSDDGMGLSKESLPLVFDLFAQANVTLDRAKGGLGLGLTLVRQLVTLHHGSVQAESDGLGEGSVFTVRLPLLAVLDSAPAPLQADHAAPTPPTTSSRRVLVVDDNADGADSMALMLEMEGHEVMIARDGVNAVEVARRTRPDVVVLDIGLPGMDGYEVARHLRGHSATAKTTLIALTGYGQAQDISEALQAGFDLHFVKPVDPDTLTGVIGRAPRGSR